MKQNLCISVRFLDPRFHGAGDDGPEWPPSPMRLFQALLAGSRAGCRDREWSKAHVDAFQWLERQEPPLIIAPPGRLAPTCTLFVPNNDADMAFDRQDRLTGKVAHPHSFSDGDSLHYLWQFDDANEPSARSHTELLCREARHLLALGWGVDQVMGNGRLLTDAQAASMTGDRWLAQSERWPGRPMCRVPRTGSLDDLHRVHQSFLLRIDDGQYSSSRKPDVFDTVVYRRATDLPSRPFAAFGLRPVDPDARTPWGACRQERAVCVAAMLRHAAWQAAKADLDLDSGGQPRSGAWRTRDWAEQFVAGHGPRKENGRFVDDNWPRFSYVPLPTIDPRGVVSMIRRVLIAEPLPQFGGDGRSAAWAANRLGGMALRDEQTGDDTALLERLVDGDAVLARYVARDNPAREWVSVTPIILPGYDDGKPAKRDRLLRECLGHAGYEEAVESVEARPAAWLAGCAPIQTFRRPAYLRHLPALHVRIRFLAPTTGPIALGAGRHCGLGAFAARQGDPRREPG